MYSTPQNCIIDMLEVLAQLNFLTSIEIQLFKLREELLGVGLSVGWSVGRKF